MKKKCLIIFLISILIISNTYSICLADDNNLNGSVNNDVETPEVPSNTSGTSNSKFTKEKLKQAVNKLNEFIKTSDDETIISMDDNSIKISDNNQVYIIKYDLTDTPTFTYEFDVQKGMHYEDFINKGGGLLISAAISYLLSANIDDVNYEDSLSYFMDLLISELIKDLDTDKAYMVVSDDYKEKPSGINIIYESEFGDRVMEVVNAQYGQKKVFDDSKKYNTFKMTIEQKDKTETSCKIVTEITIDKNADFSKIKGYSKNNSKKFSDLVSKSEEAVIKENNNKSKKDTSNTVNTVKMEKYPNAGLQDQGLINVLTLIIVVSILSLFIIVCNSKKEK